MIPHELGRGPIEIFINTITTEREEKFFDLKPGDRGFRMHVRYSGNLNNAPVLRIATKKGEVKKTTGGDYWTVDRGETFDMISGIRIMEEDAVYQVGDNAGEPIPYDQVEDGVMLEQRWYYTAESANVTVEILVMPGV